MKLFSKSIIIFSLAVFIGCSTKSTESETKSEPSSNEMKASSDVKIEGFDSIEKLAASVVNSLQNRDYDAYYTHVMNKELELTQAALIKDSVIRKEFLHEFGFSIHEEKEYFDNLLHYYDTKNIDLNKVNLEEMEFTEYKGGEYHPLELYEVFVPIIMEYEMLIDFTIIKVNNKFYLTSELGI